MLDLQRLAAEQARALLHPAPLVPTPSDSKRKCNPGKRERKKMREAIKKEEDNAAANALLDITDGQ